MPHSDNEIMPNTGFKADNFDKEKERADKLEEQNRIKEKNTGTNKRAGNIAATKRNRLTVNCSVANNIVLNKQERNKLLADTTI